MQIIRDRRALHRIPELDRSLPKTMAYLKNALAPLRCTVFSPAESSLCAFFDFGRETAIAFRSDADALPIAECSGVDFASEHPGQMHACGHDGHMAMVLELARRLNEKTELPHNVLLVFQCAEETDGGAKDICEAGVFETYRVEAIFGMHLWPGLPEGQIASRETEMLARSCEIYVDIYGKSAHIARAAEGVDAMAAGVAFYQRMQAMEAALPQEIFRLVKFGVFHSGTVNNALSAHTRLEGSIRAFQDEVYFSLREGAEQIGRDLEREFGCTVAIRLTDGYPAVMNPTPLYQKVRALVPFAELSSPFMIAEDFSWYQRHLPGMFFFLGAGDVPPLHAANFNFNEEILEKGAAFYERLAEAFV